MCFLLFLLFCFWFAFLFVLLLGQFLDCVLVHNRHFCGFLQIDSPACKLQFTCLPRLNVCNDLAEAMKALDGKKAYSVRRRSAISMSPVCLIAAILAVLLIATAPEEFGIPECTTTVEAAGLDGPHRWGRRPDGSVGMAFGLASADRLPVVVRIPAGPLGSLKCDPPKGNGRRPQKKRPTQMGHHTAQQFQECLC